MALQRWNKNYDGITVTLDFLILNHHIKKNFLRNFIYINKLSENSNPHAKNDKENLISVVEDFLTSHRFSLLPVAFCNKDNDIYPIPIVIEEFRKTEPFAYHGLRKIPEEKHHTIYNFSKFVYKSEKIVSFSAWDLQKLCSQRHYKTTFLDKEFCLAFVLDTLELKLEKLKRYEPKTNSTFLSGKSLKITESLTLGDLSDININQSTKEEKGEKSVTGKTGTTGEPVEKSENLEKLPDTGENNILIETTTEEKPDIKEFENMSITPKLQLEKWVSLEESGDATEWLKNCCFLVNLNAKNAAVGQKVSLILNAIANQDLRTKAISDFEKLEESEQSLEKLKEIIAKHTVKDQLTYRKMLKSLEYDPNTPMIELYSKIFQLVYQSMGLDPKNDESSVSKLTGQWFIEKLPKSIVTQMQDSSFEDGENLASKAEKVRSFQKIFLSDKMESNALTAQEVQGKKTQAETNTLTSKDRKDNRKCFKCQKIGHIAANCREKNDQNLRQPQNNYNNRGGHSRGGSFRGGNFRGGNSRGGNFRGGNFRGGNFRGGNRNYGYDNNRGNNGYRSNGNQTRTFCEYCGTPNHSWEDCNFLARMIQNGKISPNWTPPKAISENPHQGSREPRNPRFEQ